MATYQMNSPFGQQGNPFQTMLNSNAAGKNPFDVQRDIINTGNPNGSLGSPTIQQQLAQVDSAQNASNSFNQFGTTMGELGVNINGFAPAGFNQLSHFGKGNLWGDQFGGQNWSEALAEAKTSGDNTTIQGMIGAAHKGRKQSSKALGGFSPMMAGLLALGVGGGLAAFGGAPVSGLSSGLSGSGLLSGGTLGSTGIGAASAGAGASLGGVGAGIGGLGGMNAGTTAASSQAPSSGAFFSGAGAGDFGGSSLFGNLGLNDLSKLSNLIPNDQTGNLQGQAQNYQPLQSLPTISQGSPTFNNGTQNGYVDPNLSGQYNPYQTVQELYNQRY